MHFPAPYEKDAAAAAATAAGTISNREEATLYQGISVGPSVGWSVGNQLSFWADWERHMPCVRSCFYQKVVSINKCIIMRKLI